MAEKPLAGLAAPSDTLDQSLAAVEAEGRAASTLIIVSSGRAAYRAHFRVHDAAAARATTHWRIRAPMIEIETRDRIAWHRR
jgi:hypothetical protein